MWRWWGTELYFSNWCDFQLCHILRNFECFGIKGNLESTKKNIWPIMYSKQGFFCSHNCKTKSLMAAHWMDASTESTGLNPIVCTSYACICPTQRNSMHSVLLIYIRQARPTASYHKFTLGQCNKLNSQHSVVQHCALKAHTNNKQNYMLVQCGVLGLFA